jgi:hypothetical protein
MTTMITMSVIRTRDAMHTIADKIHTIITMNTIDAMVAMV